MFPIDGHVPVHARTCEDIESTRKGLTTPMCGDGMIQPAGSGQDGMTPLHLANGSASTPMLMQGMQSQGLDAQHMRTSIDMSKLNVSADAFVPTIVSPWAQLHTVPRLQVRTWATAPRRIIIIAQPDALLEIDRVRTEFALVFPWLQSCKCDNITPPVCTDEVYTAIVYGAFISHEIKRSSMPRTHICVISAHGGDFASVQAWMHANGVDCMSLIAPVDKVENIKGKDISALSHDELMRLRDINVEKKTKLRYNPWLRVVETIA